MLDAILFDLGDTLWNFAPMDTRAVFRISAQRTYEYFQQQPCHNLPPFQKYFRTQFNAIRWAYLWANIRRREFNGLDLLHKLCSKFRVSIDPQVLSELAWRSYSPLTDYCTIESDLVSTLRYLKNSGLKLGVVSNTFVPATALDRHLQMTSLLEFFPVRVYSGEIGFRKPDRQIFQLALRQLGCRARNTVFVGDVVKNDIVGARRLGMITVLKQPPGPSRIHPIAHYVIHRISELIEILPLIRLELSHQSHLRHASIRDRRLR